MFNSIIYAKKSKCADWEMGTGLLNKLGRGGRSADVTAVCPDGIFPQNDNETCRPMRRPKILLGLTRENVLNPQNITTPSSDTNLPSCMLSWQQHILFLVHNLYYFYTLLRPCYRPSLILPSTDKTCIVYPLQFTFFSSFFGLSEDLISVKMEIVLMTYICFYKYCICFLKVAQHHMRVEDFLSVEIQFRSGWNTCMWTF